MRKIFSAAAADRKGRFSDIIGYKEPGADAIAKLREIIHE